MVSYFALYWAIFMLWILILMFQKNKKLSSHQIKKYSLYLAKIEKLDSPSEQIVQFDKLYHTILKWYGYKGTFWEILKKKPTIITNIQNIWDLHKLRNQIVHDLVDIPEPQLEKQSRLYLKETQRILKK